MARDIGRARVGQEYLHLADLATINQDQLRCQMLTKIPIAACHYKLILFLPEAALGAV